MLDPTEAATLSKADFEKVIVNEVLRAVLLTPIEESDFDEVNALLEAGGGTALPYAAHSLGRSLSPGMWAAYLGVIGSSWEQPAARALIRELVMLEKAAADDPSRHWYDLLEAGLDALAALADGPEAAPQRLEALDRLARAVEREGDEDLAYNLAAAALDLGPAPGPARLEAAEYALKLASAADRAHQCAFVSIEVLASKLAIDSVEPFARLDAFDACERAVEWILASESPFREMAAQKLLTLVRPHDWLQPAGLPLGTMIASLAELRELLGSSTWPARVQRLAQESWLLQLKSLLDAARFENEIEAARLAVTPATKERYANVDWVTWSLDLPAYRRAVPQNRSFLREKKFDENILVLMHELTHALSLLGGIGTALLALRSAGFYNELHLWSDVEGVERGRIEEEIVAPLPLGSARHLFLAERGISLSLKAAALQDVWTPWFEGLACFAEGAADPSQDEDRIAPVAAALRNLIDFQPAVGEPGGHDDRGGLKAAFDRYALEFEQRVSQAIAGRGWQRLWDIAVLKDRHYFAGYLAVRIVVATWRATLGRAITGSEAFNLLLHATRFGTFDPVPDLSLPPEDFHRQARRKMAIWARSLAELDREQLSEFLEAPSRDGVGRLYCWREGKLVGLEAGGPEALAVAGSQQAVHERLAREAAETQVGVRTSERLARAGLLEFAERSRTALLAYLQSPPGHEEIAGQARLMDLLLERGSLFPLGHCSARFFLNLAPEGQPTNLMLFLRTTEAHVDTGAPSVNGLVMPIELEQGSALAQLYAARAVPRVEVTRLIDLGGIAVPQSGAAIHLLAFRYDRWLHVIGATPATDAMLREDPDRLAYVLDRVRRRLSPDGLEALEKAIAEGVPGARRTLDWTSAESDWRLPPRMTDATAWADQVRSEAEQLLDPRPRKEAWTEAAVELLGALWGGSPLVRDLAGSDYLDVIAGHSPQDVVKSMFRTGLRPAEEPWLDENAEPLEADGLFLFEKSSRGWDIRPAATRENAPCRS